MDLQYLTVHFGKGQPAISLFGLTYLQKISDLFTGGAMHIEPGIWIKQPSTKFPSETAPAGEELIARMGSIPNGNALLAQGVAAAFYGPPVLTAPQAQYAGSKFPSFNSTPFAVGTPINAVGSSEKLTAPGGGFRNTISRLRIRRRIQGRHLGRTRPIRLCQL